MIILKEDAKAEIAANLRRECAEQCCDGELTDVEANFVVSKSWRGWVVSCKKCNQIIVEVE